MLTSEAFLRKRAPSTTTSQNSQLSHEPLHCAWLSVDRVGLVAGQCRQPQLLPSQKIAFHSSFPYDQALKSFHAFFHDSSLSFREVVRISCLGMSVIFSTVYSQESPAVTAAHWKGEFSPFNHLLNIQTQVFRRKSDAISIQQNSSKHPLGPMSSPAMRFLKLDFIVARIPTFGVGLESNQKVIGCSHNNCAVTAAGKTCLLVCFEFQGAHLGRITFVFSPLAAFTAPSDHRKNNHHGESFQFSPSLISLYLAAKAHGIFSNRALLYSSGGWPRGITRTILVLGALGPPDEQLIRIPMAFSHTLCFC